MLTNSIWNKSDWEINWQNKKLPLLLSNTFQTGNHSTHVNSKNLLLYCTDIRQVDKTRKSCLQLYSHYKHTSRPAVYTLARNNSYTQCFFFLRKKFPVLATKYAVGDKIECQRYIICALHILVLSKKWTVYSLMLYTYFVT